MGDSSHTGMLQLPECGAQTHRVGKGSREETWEGGAGKSGHRKGHERSTKGFILPLDWGRGNFTLPDLLKKRKKKKKTKTKKKTPKHRVKLREQ